MKNLVLRKKNLIALSIAAVMVFTAALGYSAHAANLIDENEQCTLTVEIPTAVKTADNADSKKVKGAAILCEEVTVDFYKIADVELNGEYSNKLAGVDFNLIKGGELKAEDTEKFVNSAAGAVKDKKPDYTFTIKPSEKTVDTQKVDRGLYLYIPTGKDSNRYKFTFTKSIISVPTSNYIQQATTIDANGVIVEAEDSSDTWNYNPKIAIKSDAEQRYGYLRIEKLLTKANESLGTPSFVYKVDATLDGKQVFSNVYSLDYDIYMPEDNFIWIAADNGDPILPADAEITVTEVYSGASYKMTASSYTHSEKGEDGKLIEKTLDNPKIIADDVVVAKFTNDYDDELQVGAISINNRFDLKDGSYQYVGNNLSDEPINPVEPDLPIQPSQAVQSTNNEGGN